MSKLKKIEQQERVIKQLSVEFQESDRVLLNAVCAFGKTITTWLFIKQLIASGKRVAISTYSRKEIRRQWWYKNLDFNIVPAHMIQIVCSEQDVRNLQLRRVPAISNSNISDTKPVTIFIPQSISKHGDMGKFDYFIIDEAHEFLDTENRKLKRIIESSSHSGTKFLGLTGTGFELLKQGGFFHDSKCIIYDMPTALKDELVNDCETYCEYFDFTLAKKYYSGTELNKKGSKFLKHEVVTALKLKEILKSVKGKTLVIVPPLCDETICNTINRILGNGAAVRKTSKIQDHEKNEKMFRNSSQTNFMVVMRMCGTGWDFPELRNVIDLTFTKNPKVIIQRLSRVIRKKVDKILPKYIYCADQSKSETEVYFYLGSAFELMTEKGIRNYDGKVYFSKKLLKRLRKEKKRKRIRTGLASEYFNLDNEYHKFKKRIIFRRTLKELICTNHKVLLPYLREIKATKGLEELRRVLRELVKMKDNEDFVQDALMFLEQQ